MKSNKSVKIKSFTWSKDSHGLFDYESKHLEISKTFCKNDIHIGRANKKVVFANSQTKHEGVDATHLCQIKNTEDGRFLLTAPDQSSPINLVIRSLKRNGEQTGYELKAGDIIRTGRVEYYVREARFGDGSTHRAHDSLLTLNSNQTMDIECSDKEKRHCRICFSEETNSLTEDFKFITPCKCKGTSQFIHVSCLKEWLASKRVVKKHTSASTHTNNQGAVQEQNTQSIANNNAGSNTTNIMGMQSELPVDPSNNQSLASQAGTDTAGTNPNITTYTFSNFCCDVCREQLPFSIKLSAGPEVETVNIDRPETEPYLIFERLAEGKEPKTISVIRRISDQEVILGRGHLSHIQISDISVTRKHATIKFQNNRFYLFDNNSKFGTLAQVSEPIEICKEKFGIQCGRTLITMALREDKSAKAAESFNLSGMNMPAIEQGGNMNYSKRAVSRKKAQTHMKLISQKDSRDGGSEGTLDIEEATPQLQHELQSRSKKINKGNKRNANQ